MKKTFNRTSVWRGYRLAALLSLVIISSGIFTACDNFLTGGEIKDSLDKVIEYANAPYVNVETEVISSAKEKLVPAENRVYDKEYKEGDNIDLEFVPKGDWQFIKWECSPAGAVDFEAYKELKTKAKINIKEGAIKISPVVEKRPEVNFEPSNAVDQPRNTAIVVSFTKPIELGPKALDSIEISSGGENLSEHYRAEINANCTKIIFRPVRDNLVTVEKNRTINVTVPANLYSSTSDGEKIYMEKDTSYSFRVNSTTEDKAEISVEVADVKEGKLDFTCNARTFYLDNEIITVFTPEEAYSITGWKVEYSDKTAVPESVLKVEISEDKTKLSAVLLTGTDTPIVIRPKCRLRDKLKVKFLLTSAGSGSLSPVSETERSYYKDDKFDATFKMDAAWKFLGWKVTDAETKEVLNIEDIFNIEENASSGEQVKSATFTVKEDTRNIILEPECQLRKTIKISFKTEHGTTVPSETRTLYSGDTLDIRYSEIGDYAFKVWSVTDRYNSSADVSGLLKFDTKKNETTVTVLNLTEDKEVILTAECAKRPKAVSYTPTSAAGSVQRDRTIVVMFDKKMSVDSIYFTDEELVEAGVKEKSGNEYILKDEYDVLLSGKDGDRDRKAYGYYKKNDADGSSYVYKNIRITRRDNESINLLKYYGEPAFDKNDTSTLRISTKISDTDENGNIISGGKDEAPPKNIGILVALGTGMRYKTEDDYMIGLSTEVSWPYLTNKKTDSMPPVFDNGSISIVKCSENANVYPADSEHDFNQYYYTDSEEVSLVGEGKNVRITENVSRIKDFNVDTGYLWVKASASDDGSGVDSITGYLVKKHDIYYPNANAENEDEEVKEVINFELNDGSSTDVKEISQKINLAELGLDEGVYTLSFTATDANGHKTDSDCSYQFVYDVKAPDVRNFEHHRRAADKANFLWENTFASDFDKVEITTKNETVTAADMNNTFGNNIISPVSGNQDGYELELSGLTDETNYSHTLKFYDLAGNMTEIPVTKDIDFPAAISGFERTRNTSGKVDFSWTTPTEEDFSKIKIKYQIDEEDSDDIEYEKLYVKGVSSKALTGLTDYKHYKYTATVMDFAGNESTPFVLKDETVAPDMIVQDSISNTRTSAENETITWINPTTSDFAKTIIEIYKDGTLLNTCDVLKGTTSQLFVGLVDKTQYNYKLRTVDYSGNESVAVEWKDEVGPGPSSLIIKGTIKNTRTSADKETLSWTKPTALENSYYIVEQYSPSGTLVSNYELTKSDTNKLFSGMSRGKYKYRFYSVDYANNKSTTYTEWQDDVRPTAVVSNISNYRPSSSYETISWTNPTGAAFNDVDYMQVDQYEGTSLKNSFKWTPSDPATSKLFTGLVNQTKYTYKFSCVDYAGNKIAATTDWQDNDGPGAVTEVYSGGRKNYKVHLYFDTPDTDELSHVEIYRKANTGTTYSKENITVQKLNEVASSLTVINQKAKHYEVQPNSNAGTKTNYLIKAYDYAGNTSEIEVSEGYAQEGMVCHYNTARNEVFVSLNVYKNQNPVGVLYTVDEYLNTWGRTGRKVNLVYDMKEYSNNFFWGEDNGDPKNGDGKKYNGWDDYINFTDSVNHKNLYNKTVNCYSAYNRKGQTSYTIWHELYFNVNKKSIDKNNKVIWYVPAIDQFDTIISKRNSIDAGFDKLRAAGYSPVLQTAGQRLGSSSTTNDGDKYYCLTAYSITNKNFDYSRQDRDNVGTSNWHCIAEINLD